MRVAVIGAGSWGTALAMHLARVGCEVALWAREEEVVEGIRKNKRNPLFLPDLAIPREGGRHERARGGGRRGAGDRVRGPGPVRARGPPWPAAAPLRGSVLVSASKGIEVASLSRMDQLVHAELGLTKGAFVALSGPSFAREVAAGLPTAAVLAGTNAEALRELQAAFSDKSFRFYTASDVVGVELAGALKNVIAIAAGMATGLELGLNALAALLTRGLHEIARLGVKLGGREATFRGLAGMGDLVLTCTGALSRNRSVGERLGRGEQLERILAGREVAEGVPTARAASELARRHGVDMPITFAVESILAGKISPRAAVPALMTRSLKDEALL